MSYGLVVCSTCHYEVHQGSKRIWFHCHDMKPICEGATAIYPRNAEAIIGKFCGADDLDGEYKAEQKLRQRGEK